MSEPRFRHSKRTHRARSTPAGEHRPVLLQEVLSCLQPKPGDFALDCTVGFGGHAKVLMERIGPSGRLIGLDLDAENLDRASHSLATIGLHFRLHHANFAGAAAILAQEEIESVDLVLADLGMSSMQLDDAQRGFSYVREGPLDMRMDRQRGRTAAEWLAHMSEHDIAQALAEWGDEPAALAIAKAIVQTRKHSPLTTTQQLSELIGQVVKQPTTRQQGWRLHPKQNQWKTHPAARTFQALRILVNRELANLQHLLRMLPMLLKPGGRAAIISFHSGEDRLIKQAFKQGIASGVFSEGCDEPIRAGYAEKQTNPRARSAKLRWVRKAQGTL